MMTLTFANLKLKMLERQGILIAAGALEFPKPIDYLIPTNTPYFVKTPYVFDEGQASASDKTRWYDTQNGTWKTPHNQYIVFNWLIDNNIFINPREDHSRLDVDGIEVSGCDNDGFMTFYFNNQEEATLFNLTWYGNMISFRGYKG